ncbi:hypothetical protein [Geminicoccus flavidas]|uniref:hypothetical protein n=1 Tax=Geminicoccus flavidas TaxID=2506407 RepID=UPI0013580C38|nr:hypothetical protein [Geminicoccus flavidas]
MRMTRLAGALLPLLVAAPAGVHDWYQGLMSPSGFAYCDWQDCHAVPYRLNAVTGEEEVKVNGRWWPIQPRKVLPLPSLGGKVHVCWDQRFQLAEEQTCRCIILPSSSSLDVPIIG